ncbi:uracil-DNA glycosylase family protein [Paraburkholderia sp. IMGN_8]|uniref:uracil-DNA glycosylase family protein n=1 Tax=Paraburkholderia sp. IMGN_8 TaxID=3136564 RepID=UPI0031014419
MALHESVLEEFGLAPLWVRRGMAPVTLAEAVELASDVQAGNPQPAPDNAAPNSARREEPVAADLRVAAPQASPAAREQRDDQQPTAQQAPAREPNERRSPTQHGEPGRQTSPSSFSETPPDDDFAWFDDLPAPEPARQAAHAPVEEARRETPDALPIQMLDWDALSDRVAGCERCRLCEKRTNTVFGVGDRNADWMLIGEAPGENEDRQGEPFVGQAGKLLDNMLRSLTLARDTNVYIANVIKCRPPGNRNPEPDEVARCEPYLQRQVELVKPKLIVALGRFAAQSLLKTDASISSLRGRVHEYEGVPVIVTYHPAYLLRSLPDKAKAWADLCLARDTWRKAGGAASNEAK